MSGTYDPTNLRDDRHPLRALGMAFGQRQAMDQAYEGAQPQYQGTPLAAQLVARPNPMMGAPAAGGAPVSPFANMGSMGPQIGKGVQGLYDWARGPRQDLGAMDAKQAYLNQTQPPVQGGLY